MFTTYKSFITAISLFYLIIGMLFMLVTGKQNVPTTTNSPVIRKNPQKIYPKEAIPGYLQTPYTKVHPDTPFGPLPNFLSETDFTVYIGSGKEDCYYYYVMAGSRFYVAAQVLKGGDGSIGLGVRQPMGDIVLPYKWSPVAEYLEDKAQEGYYSICLDNIFASSGGKLVKLYMSKLHSENVNKLTDILDVRSIRGYMLIKLCNLICP